MKLYKVGETSRAICPVCKTARPTTFQEHDIPLASGKVVSSVLVAECDVCHSVVAIPQQSAPRIAEVRARERHTLEAHVPPHLIDGVNLVSSQLGHDPSAGAVIFRYYLRRISRAPRRLEELSASAEAQGAATARFSAKLSNAQLAILEQLRTRTQLKKADIVRGILAGIKRDVLDAPKGAARSELREILAVAVE
jgi:hypothetical protein